jgi:hypothetical protein
VEGRTSSAPWQIRAGGLGAGCYSLGLFSTRDRIRTIAATITGKPYRAGVERTRSEFYLDGGGGGNLHLRTIWRQAGLPERPVLLRWLHGKDRRRGRGREYCDRELELHDTRQAVIGKGFAPRAKEYTPTKNRGVCPEPSDQKRETWRRYVCASVRRRSSGRMVTLARRDGGLRPRPGSLNAPGGDAGGG